MPTGVHGLRLGVVLEYELTALLAAGPGSSPERTRRYV
jgi:hypothetical protein